MAQEFQGKAEHFDVSELNVKNYKEALVFMFGKMIKDLPPNLADWPQSSTGNRAVMVPVPGHERGLVLDIMMHKIQDVIPDTDLKA